MIEYNTEDKKISDSSDSPQVRRVFTRATFDKIEAVHVSPNGTRGKENDQSATFKEVAGKHTEGKASSGWK